MGNFDGLLCASELFLRCFPAGICPTTSVYAASPKNSTSTPSLPPQVLSLSRFLFQVPWLGTEISRESNLNASSCFFYLKTPKQLKNNVWGDLKQFLRKVWHRAQGNSSWEQGKVRGNHLPAVNSVVLGSQGAPHYLFNRDHKSPEKHRQVIEANSKSRGEEWEGRERAVFD